MLVLHLYRTTKQWQHGRLPYVRCVLQLRSSAAANTWMGRRLETFWQASEAVKNEEKGGIIFVDSCNSSAVRQVYSLLLAGQIPETNFPASPSENNSLFFCGGRWDATPIFISQDNLWPENHMTLSAGDPSAARQSVWDASSLLPNTLSLPGSHLFLSTHLSCVCWAVCNHRGAKFTCFWNIYGQIYLHLLHSVRWLLTFSELN